MLLSGRSLKARLYRRGIQHRGFAAHVETCQSRRACCGDAGVEARQPLDSQRNSELAARTLQLNARAVSRAVLRGKSSKRVQYGGDKFYRLIAFVYCVILLFLAHRVLSTNNLSAQKGLDLPVKSIFGTVLQR